MGLCGFSLLHRRSLLFGGPSRLRHGTHDRRGESEAEHERQQRDRAEAGRKKAVRKRSSAVFLDFLPSRRLDAALQHRSGASASAHTRTEVERTRERERGREGERAKRETTRNARNVFLSAGSSLSLAPSSFRFPSLASASSRTAGTKGRVPGGGVHRGGSREGKGLFTLRTVFLLRCLARSLAPRSLWQPTTPQFSILASHGLLGFCVAHPCLACRPWSHASLFFVFTMR